MKGTTIFPMNQSLVLYYHGPALPTPIKTTKVEFLALLRDNGG